MTKGAATMTLADINSKYRGRPLDMSKWQFSGMAEMGILALAVNDVELDDGCFYDFRATIAMEWSGNPSDIVRHGEYGTFASISAVEVTRNGEAKPLENGGDIFADAIDTMIASAFGMEPSTKAKAVIIRNDVYPHDYPKSNDAAREDCDRAWENIKKELVHYTARKYNLPEPQDLSEKAEDYPFLPPPRVNSSRRYSLDNLLAYRMEMEYYICGDGRQSPSWRRSSAWVNLRNAMLDEMFDRTGVDLPPEAHSLPYMYNGKKRDTWERLLPKRVLQAIGNEKRDVLSRNESLRSLKFPFSHNELEEATAKFLSNEEWKSCYNAAPEGAKRRLELSFWYTEFGRKAIDDDAKRNNADIFMKHRDYMADLEGRMSLEELTFMAKAMHGKPAAEKHYKKLIEAKSNPNSKYMTYEQFFKLVRDQGDYKTHKWNDGRKKAIINDFITAVERNHDPLEARAEDIIATAKVDEVRTYPEGGWMYVLIMVRILNANANWGKPFRIAALFDANSKLQGYTFVESGMIFEYDPEEIKGEPTEAQRLKRQALRDKRAASSTK